MGTNDRDYKTISTNALIALKRLGEESPVNAERVRGLYNIDQDDRVFRKD